MATFRIANVADFLRSVEEAKARVSDLSVPMGQIARDWMRTNQAYFTQSPGVYADLSSRGSKTKVRGFGKAKTGESDGKVGGYKKAKLRRWGFVYPVLVASGRLRSSLTVPGDANSIFQLLNGSTLMLGTRAVSKTGAPYPYFLHHGTRYTPARPFIEIPQLSVARWKGMLKAFVLEQTQKAGQSAA